MSGTATPNMLLDSLGKLIGKEFEPLAEEWSDVPLQVYLAKQNIASSMEFNEKNIINKSLDMQSIINPIKELQRTIEGALNE